MFSYMRESTGRIDLQVIPDRTSADELRSMRHMFLLDSADTTRESKPQAFCICTVGSNISMSILAGEMAALVKVP
jgi:hypothetical protein